MHLIFDFDGTLIDSFHCAAEKLIHLAEEFQFRQINKQELGPLRELSSKDLITYLQIPIYKIPQVIFRARKEMSAEIANLSPFSMLQETLQTLSDAGCSLGILTSNSISNVSAWLRHHNLQHLFNFIHSEAHYFGKTRMLKKLIRQYKVDKSQAFYIGDETRDIEAAKQSGLHSIAVTWGFNSEKILSEYQPEFIARKPEDLLSILKLC